MKPAVKLPDGLLVLDGWKWQVQGWVSPASLQETNKITQEFLANCSPADGFPQHALALRVAKALKGKAVLPPVPETRPGIIY